MTALFFDSWQGLARALVLAVASYAALVFFLRLSGKRTLSKMNAFDLVITVALGSSLATIVLNKNVALAEGLLAFAMFIGLQFSLAWLCVRSKQFEALVKSEPALVVCEGRLLNRSMARHRVTETEVLAAIRSAGLSAVEDAAYVVLETDGSFSVVPREQQSSRSALKGIAAGES